jgi:hypothetical protein
MLILRKFSKMAFSLGWAPKTANQNQKTLKSHRDLQLLFVFKLGKKFQKRPSNLRVYMCIFFLWFVVHLYFFLRDRTFLFLYFLYHGHGKAFQSDFVFADVRGVESPAGPRETNAYGPLPSCRFILV